MRLYFASNRQVTSGDKKFGKRYSQNGPQFFRVGHVDAEWDEQARKAVNLQVEIYPEIDGTAEAQGSGLLFPDVSKKASSKKRDVLVFIHGYNVNFTGAALTAAQLRQNWLIESQHIPSPIVSFFSWPSDGQSVGFGESDVDHEKWAYISDREDASISGEAMARALLKLIDFLKSLKDERRKNTSPDEHEEDCEQRLHLVVHSMGAFALGSALTAMRKHLKGQRLPKVFENTFLCAADVDANAFEYEHKLGLLPQLSHRCHVYYNSGDKALLLSSTTKFNGDRLGAVGPRTLDGLPSSVMAIDCSEVVGFSDGISQHGYFAENPKVITDIREVLNGTHPDDIPRRKVIQSGRIWRLTR